MDNSNEIFRVCNDGNPNEIEITTDESEMELVENVQDEAFKVLTVVEIEEMMEQCINDIKSIVSMPDSDVRILLNHTKWDTNELLLRLTNANRAEFMANANVSNPFANVEDHPLLPEQQQQNITCTNCLKDMIQEDSVGLRCAHELCTDCYREYLTKEIMNENATESIYCPAENCDKIVDSDFIMQLITDENVRLKYTYLMANSFVQCQQWLRWCTVPACPLVIQANPLLRSDYKQNCMCSCGQRFCFNCQDECHDPLPCELISKWKKNGYGKTAVYLTLNLKNCPKCAILIEKDGDCNHMKCEICEHEFCWMCCGEWNNPEVHNDCSNDDEHTDNDVENLEKYRNHLMCYKSNEVSLEREKMLADSVTMKDQIQKLVNKGVSNCNAQFLAEAVKILCESRKQLMLSYIFAYFVESNSQKEIFEMNQYDLQLAIEKLSMYLEHEITNDNAMDIVQNVKDKALYCKRRQQVLDKHIYEGFVKKWWSIDCNF